MNRALICLVGVVILVTALCVPINMLGASAIDLPYVVVGDDLWLLHKSSGQKLFLLPQTYYARIDNIDDNYYYITFNGVSGKVERSLASTVGYHTQADGTMVELKIDSKFNIFTEVKLKSTMEGNSTDIAVPVDESLMFIGKYPMVEDWYYVKHNNNYGYIKAEFTDKPNIEYVDFIPSIKPIEIGSDDIKIEKPSNNNSIIKILVITGLSVVLLIILIVLFRPNKSNKHRYYYEE